MTRSQVALRIGDAERDATVELLNRHFADGRLAGLEREERVTAALTATTQPALDALLADLPDLPSAAPAARRRTGSLLAAAPGVMRLALLAALVTLVVAHAVPVFPIVVVFFVFSRLAFGPHRPWARDFGRYGPGPRR